MRIVLELQGYLAWYSPGGLEEMALDVPVGTTARQAIRLARLPHGEVAFASVGGALSELDDPLHEGDRVLLIPPIAGG